MNNPLGRATGREKIKNKDQAPAGSGRNPALASLLSPSQVFLLLSCTFSPTECLEMRGGTAKPAVSQQSISSLSSSEERGKGLPKELWGRELRDEADRGSVVVPLLSCSTLQPREPSTWLDWSDGNFPSQHPVTQVPLGQVTTLAGM